MAAEGVSQLPEFSFRVWSSSLKSMDYSPLNAISFDGKIFYGNADFSDFYQNLMFYIRKTDIQGKKIYTDDLVEDTYGRLFLVKASTHFLRIQLVPANEKAKACFDYEVPAFDWFNPDCCVTVVGNRFENPNLCEIDPETASRGNDSIEQLSTQVAKLENTVAKLEAKHRNPVPDSHKINRNAMDRMKRSRAKLSKRYGHFDGNHYEALLHYLSILNPKIEPPAADDKVGQADLYRKLTDSK